MDEPETRPASAPEPATGAALACGWCGTGIVRKHTGRTPKWCSDTCRHRAWEQARAAGSGRSAVQLVERVVERKVPVEVVREVEVQTTPKGARWVPALHELARQVDAGGVYDRDLGALIEALGGVDEALRRRIAARARLR
jgi:hypothetical protein